LSYALIEYPSGFLDVRRVGQKVLFDGYRVVGPYVAEGIEIPAYEFGVQTIYHMKIMAAGKDVLANCEVVNPGRYGNSVKIYIYIINPDGTIRQADDGYGEYKIEFNGEGE